MKKIQIKALHADGVTLTAEVAAKLLEEQTTAIPVDTINWPDYPYKPEVNVRIGYLDRNICLTFHVKEKNILARATKINGDVYKDSCVEFFFSPRQNDYYYNFEFSCIGTPHVGYGEDRNDREQIDPSLVEKIQRLSSLGNKPFEEKTGDFEWTLTVVIPHELFVHDVVPELSGLESKGNFYKCGDLTSEPHFVSWNPVETKTPDYHQYVYFGDFCFE